MNRQNKSTLIAMGIIGAVAIIWLALLAAPTAAEGLLPMLQGLSQALEQPFVIRYCDNTIPTVLWCLGIYALVLPYIQASIRNTRFGEEHGSAQWGDAAQLCNKLQSKTFSTNIILTQNTRIGFDFYRHRRNANVAIVAGSGAGKSRGHVMPNLMQNNCSVVVTDPKGENLRTCGTYLAEHGTEVRVLDLIELSKSSHYNPFCYIRSEKDVQTMVQLIFTATTKKGSGNQDPFFENAAQILLKAFCLYLWMEAPPEEQNFTVVLELLRAAAFTTDDPGEKTVTDILFDRLEEKDPAHPALKAYRTYRTGSTKTLQSVQIVLAAHLDKFDLQEVAAMTCDDEMHLRELGERKIALFLRISDSDPSMNFLVSILYTQLIQQLFDSADLDHHGPLPVHVHFLMDEFANVAMPNEFEQWLSTMRSRNISASILLQNISQLKSMFEKKWESILGNCDTFLYLGGNEQSTHEYVSKSLGKETIWTRSENVSRGKSGHTGQNNQTSGRELLTTDEVRGLDNTSGILLIRGFRPVLDRKYDITMHPCYTQSAAGGGAPYVHSRAMVNRRNLERKYPWADPAQLDQIQAAIDEELPADHLEILALPDWTAEEMARQREDYRAWKTRNDQPQQPQYSVLTDRELEEMLL